MGKLLGIPEWMAMTGLVFGFSAILFGIGWLNVRGAQLRVAARRPNPTEAEFLAMMAQDCSPEAARFVWAQALPQIEPRLTPHPDDLLLEDLCINDDDVEMFWSRDWVEQQGFSSPELHEWPESWPLTVRNFARWLDLARPSAAG